MIKEAIGIADTVDEAKEKAIAELNASFDDDVQVEVLVLPKKKTLGLFGGCQAQVKVSVEVPDPKPARGAKSGSKGAKRPAKEEQKSAAPKQSKPEKKEKEPASQKAEKASAASETSPAPLHEIPASEVPKDTPAGKAVAYLSSVLDKLGCNGINITVAEIESGSQITLTGEGLGVVIGHRGETLDALQYLVSLAANAGVSGYYRVVLNTGDFRQKREQTLIALAKRMSEQAIKSGKCRTLEPMNPYERRIIHTTVQSIEGVTSTSFGEGSGRRVVIAPEGKEPRPRNDFRSGGRSSGGRGRGGRNSRAPQRREAYQPQINPDKAPVKDADAMPLYGRIDK